MVKNLLAIWETQVQSLRGEDPLEEGMAAHSSLLAWRTPWTEETGEFTVRGIAESTQPSNRCFHSLTSYTKQMPKSASV